MWGRKPWSTELAPSMSDVDLPTGYSGEAGNLFNNSKSKSVLGAADETSAPTMNDSTGSSSITVTTWKSGQDCKCKQVWLWKNSLQQSKR